MTTAYILLYNIIENVFVEVIGIFTQYITSKYRQTRHQLTTTQPISADIELTIDPLLSFQTILGFGGAFTESACYTLGKLSKANQEKILKLYFDPETGLGYSLGRVHINSCDFSLDNYTYVKPNDVALETFDISRERKYVIPTILAAGAIRKQPIQLLASPWSPPAWMKSNGEMNHGGTLLDQYKPAWANYYVKYLDHMKEAGLNFFALTVQNEPQATQSWDSCIYSGEEERDFIKDHLGPALAKSNHPEVKLLGWDHNRDVLVKRAQEIYSDSKANAYTWGMAVHWYVSDDYSALSTVHNLFPDKHLLFTEGCIEGGPRPGVYESGERYARNMIGDISNWCEGYIDWNLVLDEKGGPNHVGNFCDAPILCDTVNDTFTINYSYDAIGHFSKYVLSGAKRIDSKMNSLAVQQVAFLNPDGSIVVVLLNETENDHGIELIIKDKKSLVTCEKRSISTLIVKGVLA